MSFNDTMVKAMREHAEAMHSFKIAMREAPTVERQQAVGSALRDAQDRLMDMRVQWDMRMTAMMSK